MAYTSKDDVQTFKRNKKYGSTVRFTYEMMRALISLPEECRIVEASGDSHRDIVTFKIHSDNELPGVTYEVEEGCQYKNINITSFAMAKQALFIAETLKKRAEDGDKDAINIIKSYENERDSNQ